MAGPQPIEWRCRAPQRALSNLGWYGVAAGIVVACCWLLFGGESGRLDDGTGNLLARLPVMATALAVLGGIVTAFPAVRRPLVAANHFALLVRPGFGGTLTLPWAGIAEVAVLALPACGRILLIRLRQETGLPVAKPGWLAQAPLRRLKRGSAAAFVGGYDLAVDMRHFVGGAHAQLAALAAFAPDTVTFLA